MDDAVDARGVPAFARGYERVPGRIGRMAKDSERAWPREAIAPEGAPNVVFVMVDDMGFSDIGPFGSEIETPNLNRVAAAGVRLTNYHTTPVCSPSRAAALTGLNSHRAGFAHLATADAGFPNMRLELADDVLTIPEILRSHGYATFGIGKWHLSRYGLMNPAASNASLPVQRGFDRYYGTLEGAQNFFHPGQLVSDNTPLEIDEFPDGYYLTDDFTDRAVSMIKGLRANDPRKPFFLYFAHHAVHGPLGVKPEDLAKFRGRYDRGWDEVRRDRHQRQLADGMFPSDMPLPSNEAGPRAGVQDWASLSEEHKRRFARYMEVYAAMVHSIDASLGRVLDTLDQLGEFENTIVIFTSDNGGTREAGTEGTRSYASAIHVDGRMPQAWPSDVDRDIELIGGPRTLVHYPRGWARASNTPFRMYKGQTFAGGIRVPFLLSWPAEIARAPGDSGLRPQYQYVTDILPTLLDLIGVDTLADRHGRPAKTIDGFSFKTVLEDAAAASTHLEQYAEFGGNRGFYRDGWKIITNHEPGTPIDDGEWELYHVEEDPNELHDLSADLPVKLKDLAARWERAAWENTVFPIGGGGFPNLRRASLQHLERPVTFFPGTPRVDRHRADVLIKYRSFAIDIDLCFTPGDTGVLLAHGDQGGGYLIYVEDDAVRVAYNEYGKMHHLVGPRLAAGEHRITLDALAIPEIRWRLRLLIDGQPSGEMPPVWMLVGFAPCCGIDIGLDRNGPVDWDLYQRHGTFPYRGGLRSVTYRPGEPADYDPAIVIGAEEEAFLLEE
jgi:arylsulfatase A-like enzyme